MKFRKAIRPAVAINIAPLVDVVFLLVIFFAVSTTFLETAGLKLELPSSTSTAQREPKEITVLLASDGTLSFDGDPTRLATAAIMAGRARRVADDAALAAFLEVKIMRRAVLEIFGVLDIQLADRESHAEMIALHSSHSSILPQSPRRMTSAEPMAGVAQPMLQVSSGFFTARHPPSL